MTTGRCVLNFHRNRDSTPVAKMLVFEGIVDGSAGASEH
jgi:hypothetical protein